TTFLSPATASSATYTLSLHDALPICFGDGQGPEFGNLELQGEIRTLGKVIVEKSAEVVVVAGRQRAAALHQLRRRHAGSCAGFQIGRASCRERVQFSVQSPSRVTDTL